MFLAKLSKAVVFETKKPRHRKFWLMIEQLPFLVVFVFLVVFLFLLWFVFLFVVCFLFGFRRKIVPPKRDTLVYFSVSPFFPASLSLSLSFFLCSLLVFLCLFCLVLVCFFVLLSCVYVLSWKTSSKYLHLKWFFINHFCFFVLSFLFCLSCFYISGFSYLKLFLFNNKVLVFQQDNL